MHKNIQIEMVLYFGIIVFFVLFNSVVLLLLPYFLDNATNNKSDIQ